MAVIYPDIEAPYSSVFDTILAGLKSDSRFVFQFLPVDAKPDLERLRGLVLGLEAEGVIALGRSGYLAAKKLDLDLPVVAGALQIVPNGFSGISLAVDPESLFRKLRLLIPEVERVDVVYTPQINGWMMPLARAAAKRNGITLNTYPASDLREAMFRYRDLLKSVRGPSNAIWLPLDRVTADDDVVLPMLLQRAWDRDLVLCSSKPVHVKRGALFSMYPDHSVLGLRLAEMLERHFEAPGAKIAEVVPVSDLLLAVNLRTAAHLGLSFSSRVQEEFTLTFPTR